MLHFILALLKMASLSACRLHTAAMSGLCPPVPTELVSVFYLKTGSVQQEQECSLLTSRIYAPCHLINVHWTCRKAAQLRLNISFAGFLCLLDTHHRAVWGVTFKSLALMKIKPEPSNLSGDGTEPWSVCKVVQLQLDYCPLLCWNMNVLYADSQCCPW